MAATPVLLHKLLFRRQRSARLWTALSALCTGMTLLLLSVLIWWNFNELLSGRGQEDDLGSTFLTISKRVTNERMGRPGLTVFTPAEIDALKQAPDVADAGELLAVKEKVNMRMQLGGSLGFSTILFLEAVPDRFMDKRPADWQWQSGSTQVPVILSSEFLSLYNYVFAPSQGLPQLSEESIRALPFRLEVGPDGHEEAYIAHIAGFSDRITSVLVPEHFARYINGRSGMAAQSPSRLVVKVKDPSAPAFNRFLSEHDYVTNAEQLRWSKLRAVVQAVAGATGILALLLMGVSVLVFVLFIELTVARAHQSVQLLLELGYSPAALGRYLYRRFLPMLLAAVGIAAVLACMAQALASVYGRKMQLHLPVVPGWPAGAAVLLCLLILLYQVKRAVGKALRQF